MQEVFEKIIEKLTNIEWAFADYYQHGTNISRVCKESVPRDEVVEIVKQAEEQCKSIYMDGEYCWQSCLCTDRCGECKRLCNGYIDYYESSDAINNR